MIHLKIHKTTMGFHVKVNTKGLIEGTHLDIYPFSKQFEHWQFDPQQRRNILTHEFYYFDKAQEICYFPSFAMDDFCTYLKSSGITPEVITVPPVEGAPSNFLMLPHVEYKNDKQKNAVAFLTDPKSGPLRGLALQTGSGKSISFVWALQKLQKRAIITMTSRLEQWVSEIEKYTNLEEEDDLYVVQGVGSLTKLFNQIDDVVKPKIILASTKTIRLYIDYGPTYQHLPHPSKMCEKLGTGIYSYDETHESFYTNFLTGLLFNPAIFIPITATFTVSDPFIKNIFDKVLPESIRFTGGEYDRFVDVTAYKYKGAGHLIRPYHYTQRSVYSQVKFEDFLLSKKGRAVFDPLVKDAILPIIKEHYINLAEDGEKFLMLCATKDMCKELATIFKRHFSNKQIDTFYSGKPVHILEKSDMIISTPGSAGTGRDIKNLRTCFIFESVASEVRNLQFIGRLRGPPQMLNTPHFVYLNFTCIPSHERHAGIRAMMYSGKAKSFKHRTIF